MRRMRMCSLIVLVLGAHLGAQGSPDGWVVTGMLGTQFRTEHGTFIDGASIGLGVVLPSNGAVRWGVDADGVQVLARAMVGPIRASAVESSIEGGVMAMTDLLRKGDWRLEGGGGVIVSLGLGCGRYQQDPVNTTAGSGGCVNSFAQRGDVRIGARVRILSEWMSPRASFFAAAIASVNTIASGSHVAPGALAGVRVPLSSSK